VSEFDASPVNLGVTAHPMGFSEVLDRVWTILRRNLRLFVQLAAIPAGSFVATYALIFGGMFVFGVFPHPGQAPDPQRMIWAILPIVLVACAPMVVVYALFEASVTQATLAANRGIARSFVEAYGAAWDRLGRIVWLMILRWLWIMLPAALVFGVVGAVTAFQTLAGRSSLNPGLYFVLLPLVVLSYVASIGYAVWMTLRLGLAVPACLAEEKTATEALRRSARLTHKSKGRIFLVMLVVYAISYGAMLVLEMVAFAVFAVIALIGSALHVHLTQPLAWVGLGTLGIGLFGTLFLIAALAWASYVVTFAVFYDDQRLRLEGAAPAIVGGGSA
jgi:hypothetical protein